MIDVLFIDKCDDAIYTEEGIIFKSDWVKEGVYPYYYRVRDLSTANWCRQYLIKLSWEQLVVLARECHHNPGLLKAVAEEYYWQTEIPF